jgi:hypothetical protein
MKHLHLSAGANVGLKGFFRLQCINKFSGKVTQDTGWFPNTILTAGRNVMANDSLWMLKCQVGTDNTAPTPADTSLLGHHAGTDTIQSTITGQAPSGPYYGWKRKVFRFAAGTVAANLSEAGVGWGTTGSTLISRALILDPILQTPTTITPLADELLDVTYELRYYPPLVDVTSPQVVLDGVTYNTITRASRVTDAAWSSSIGSAMGVLAGSVLSDWKAWDGDIGTILLGPSGLNAQRVAGSIFTSAYIGNSYEVDFTVICASTGWNLGLGIRSIDILTTAGRYQTQFNAVGTDNRIPKDTNYNLTLSWTLGWTEKV